MIDMLEFAIKWLQVSDSVNANDKPLILKIRFMFRGLVPSDRATCKIVSRVNSFDFVNQFLLQLLLWVYHLVVNTPKHPYIKTYNSFLHLLCKTITVHILLLIGSRPESRKPVSFLIRNVSGSLKWYSDVSPVQLSEEFHAAEILVSQACLVVLMEISFRHERRSSMDPLSKPWDW